MIGVIRLLNCSEKFRLESQGLPSDVSDCVDEFTGKLACAHSITFGLISAVVINETGSSDSETAMQRLSSIVKPISKRRQDNYENANIFQRALCSVIVLLPAVYGKSLIVLIVLSLRSNTHNNSLQLLLGQDLDYGASYIH